MIATAREAHRSRRLRRRAGLLAFFIPMLSLVLVVNTPGTAAAWQTPTPVVIRGALASPPARIVSYTPAGRVVTLGIMAGLLLYETRDTWLPILQDDVIPQGVEWASPMGFDPVQSQPGMFANNHKCNMTAQTPSTGTGVDGNPMGVMTVLGECGGPGAWWSSGSPGGQVTADIACRNPSTGEVRRYRQTGLSPQEGMGSLQGPETGAKWNTYNIWQFGEGFCDPAGAGFSLMHVHVIPQVIEYAGMTPLDIFFPDNVWEPEEHVQRTEVDCKNFTTGELNTIVSETVGQPERVTMPSCAERHPGSEPTSCRITAGVPGYMQPVGTCDLDETLREQWKDCFGPGGLNCTTTVWVDGNECAVGVEVCTRWPQIHRVTPSRVECKFGPYPLPIGDCDLLKRAFQRERTIANPNDIPDTVKDPVPEDDPTPSPSPSPSTTPSPSPSTTTSPTTSPSTSPTTTTSPTAGPNPLPPPETPKDDSGQGCLGAEWTWNPVSWVYAPVKCALKWAFVPKTPIAARVNAIKTSFADKFPFSLPAAIAGMGTGAGGGCPDWRVIVDANAGSSVNKNVVCDSSFTAAIRGARPFLFAGMVAVAFWPLVRGMFFASVPIIKPHPGER